MGRHAGATGAESCWDDRLNEDEDCEKYLQRQKVRNTVGASDEETGDDNLEKDAAEDEDDEETEYDDDGEDGVATEEAVAESTEEEDSVETEEDDPVDAEHVATPSTKPKGRKMVKAKATGGKTKADAIREVIESRKNSGAELRPRDIIATLEKKGIPVNASQVSITLRSMGIPASRKGGGRTKKAAENGEAAKSRVTHKARAKDVAPSMARAGDDQHPTEALLDAAGEFIEKAGNFANAAMALSLYHRIATRG